VKKPKPLTDESGEVRELLTEDLKTFRPIARVVSPSLAAKLGIETRRSGEPLSTEHIREAQVVATTPARKKKSGVPTGNAGEYFVMGELLRRGFDAQLADRNTKGYDLAVGRPDEPALRKVQVKTVRAAPWYVNLRDFSGEFLDRVTVYVLLGKEDARQQIRFFIAKNRAVQKHIHRPSGSKQHGLLSMKVLKEYEDKWDSLFA
jgi:hypothetical protein